MSPADRLSSTNLGKLDFKGWRQLSCDLTHDNGHWGGDASGKIKLPLQFDSLLVDSGRSAPPSARSTSTTSATSPPPIPKDAFQVTADSGWFGDVVFSAEPWSLKVTVRNMVDGHVGGALVVSAADSRGNPVAHSTQTVSLDGGAATTVALKPSRADRGPHLRQGHHRGHDRRPLPPRRPSSAQRTEARARRLLRACTHFGQGKHSIPQTLELMRRGGIEWLRDEIGWGAVEKTKGVYTYDNYYEQYMAPLARLA